MFLLLFFNLKKSLLLAAKDALVLLAKKLNLLRLLI